LAAISTTPAPRRTGLLLATLVPALAAGGLVAHYARTGGVPQVAGVPAPALARLADLSPAIALPGDPAPLRPVIATDGRAGLRIDRLESLSGGVRPARPARISIPAAAVDAVIEPVRRTPTGIEVPQVGRAGWFEEGPRPGEPGRAIVIGHLDGRTGPGLFSRVPTIPAGTPLSITDGRGKDHTYNVVGVTQVEKLRFPTASVYGASRRSVLVLITCGGPYRPGRGYRDNVLVYAREA
jgi:sortase family protein